MAAKGTEQILIGALMRNPTALLQTEKYQIETSDFETPVYRYIYYAIYDMVQKGACESITVPEIENWLGENSRGRAIYESNAARQPLVDALEHTDGIANNVENAYNNFKRENVIRDLKKSGFDTSEFYMDTDNGNSDKRQEVNDKFNTLSPADILETVDNKVLQLKGKYLKGDSLESQSIYDNIEEMIFGLEESPEIGLPLQGNLFNHIVSGALLGKFYLRSAASGVGKALPDSVKIPTPNGWRKVGEINKGDYLFDAFGKPTQVLEVFPQKQQEVWEVVFKDGRTAKCSPDHLWSFNTAGQRKPAKEGRKFLTETTEQISKRKLQKSDQAFTVLAPMQYAVEYPERKFFLKPYSMGLLLGDGSFRQNENNKALQYSSEDKELPESIAEEMGWVLKRGSERNYSWYFGEKGKKKNKKDKKNIWVEDALIDYSELMNTYSDSKFIPRDYLESSIKQRLDLINGLLDSDGSVDEKGRVRFFTNSQQLRDDFIELAQSLGFKTHFMIDSRKGRDDNYVIKITGRPEDKNKLFKLNRKRKLMQEWYDNGKRKETNTHNPIVEIRNLKYKEKMTCFLVDNSEHLFLTENFIVTHNTRLAFGDAAYMAFPIRYNWDRQEWEQVGYNQKVLFIITEQDIDEVQKMAIAYLSDINESVFKRGQTNQKQKEVIRQAIEVLKCYQDNLQIVRVPNPSISQVKQIIREEVISKDIQYVFYDYIFESPALYNEFQGYNLRTDQILFAFSDALKSLAVELDIFIMSSTQVNAKGDDNRNIRGASALAGSRAIINKADMGSIMARPTKEELQVLSSITNHIEIEPNIVTDIFKLRGGQHTQVRIWSCMDLGTLKRQDLFVTNSRLEAVDIGYENMGFYIENEDEAIELMNKLNGGVL